MVEMTVVPQADLAAKIATLQHREDGLLNEVAKWRARAFYAEGALKEAEETICPMAVGDPHRQCGIAEALADALARACERDPTLSDWLDETASDASVSEGGRP